MQCISNFTTRALTYDYDNARKETTQQNGYDARYTFSAKEKDDETQYSYFGARYYDSDLSVWLSVDPMSDKRSWISPYNYCQWNPVGRVDPSGALDVGPDNYVTDDLGNITLCEKTNDDFDVIYTANPDGTINKDGPSQKVSKGVLNAPKEQVVTYDEEVYTNHYYSGINYEEGKALFDFMRNNTSVEFNIWGFDENTENSSYILSTSHCSNAVLTTKTLINMLLEIPNLTSHTHNHPGSNRLPTDCFVPPNLGIERNGDICFARDIQNIFPDRCIEFRIFPGISDFQPSMMRIFM